jgi:hypothetical protein
MQQHWWIVLAEVAGERVEHHVPGTDQADVRRYFLTTNPHWQGVVILSITRFGPLVGPAF